MGTSNSLPILQPSQVELELSGCSLKRIPFRIKKGNSLITLNLSCNEIKHLPKHLESVCEINLSNNNLNILPKKIIKRLVSYPNLKILDISSNKISIVPISFSRFQNLKQIKLSNNNIKEITNIPSSIEGIDISQNMIKKIPEIPDHVKFIIFDYNFIKKIKKGILPSLSRLFINMNKLVSIDGDIVFSSLEILEVSKNRLRYLPDFTKFAPNIKKIDASNNFLTEFPKVPKTIIELCLERNQITSIPNNLKNFTNLKIFKISKNKITHFPALPSSIRNLEIDSNLISNIEKSNTPHLDHFLIYDNKLTDIPEFMRNKCTQITFIRNEISKITVANLSSQIARLNISENHLKKVPPEIFHLPKLTHLNLSRNQIKKLPKTFHESNLICINISENPIEKIPLEYPNTLAAFYCSYCNLKEIPSVLTTLTNLITFVSCGNKLKTIPKLPYIQKLLLSHNKLRKFPENLSDTLSVLDLSYNKIKEIPNVITLPSLQEVDLSFNEISILPNFNDCILLNTIKISNNPIITGTMKLDNFIHLDCIDISYTNITLLDVNESIREIVTSNPTLFKSPQYKLMQKNEYVSFAELKGHRDTMEDSLVVFSNIIPNFDLFCVFDGHGGSYTSTICSYEIIKYFQSCDLAEDEINEKFIEQFFECILLKLKEMNVKDGSTLALTLVSNDEIIISHLGDSRVLLIEENGEIRHATIDHKPDDKNEIKRILKEGGKVFKGRVSGTLSIARCLGDFYIPGIGRTPTTVKLELTHEDKWLILGCDGLFDLITNEEIAKIAMKADNPTELAYDLRNIAYHRYSPDNISVIAVDLQKKKTI